MEVKLVLLLYFLNKNKRLFFLKYFVRIPWGKKFVADLVVVGFMWFVFVLFCFLKGLCCLIFYCNNFFFYKDFKIFLFGFALAAE